jgi:hypothetical protein
LARRVSWAESVMVILAASVSAMEFPMGIMLRKVAAMEKFSSFDVATRSAMASAKFFSF